MLLALLRPRELSFAASETCNNETLGGDISQTLGRTKEGMCNIQTAEGSPVISNRLRRIRLRQAASHTHH